MSARVVLVCTEAPQTPGLGHLGSATDIELRWVVVRPGHGRLRWHEGRRPPTVSPTPVDPDRISAPLADLVGRLDPGTVLLPMDRAATVGLHALRASLADVLVVDTPEHAMLAARMIGAGRTVADLVAPPPQDSVRVPEPTVEEAGGDGPWLSLAAATVTVRTAQLSPAAQTAVRERSHLAVQHPGGERGRLLIAPANYAGQGWAWARAVRHHVPGWDARTLTVASPRATFHFESDVAVPAPLWSDPLVRLDRALSEVLPATHILLEAMRPIVGGSAPDLDGWDVAAAVQDARALVASGRPTALLFHGTEVRRPGVHAAGLGWTPFAPASGDRWTDHLDAVTDRVHAAADDLGLVRFVSTPDLLDYLPDATWLPISLLPGDFTAADEPLTRPRPVVLHLPSASRLKGTADIEAALEDLHRRGLIEYRRPAAVAPALVPHLLREADVVVDQVVLGNPGVLAAQAMAAGRLVIAHLPDHVRRRFPMPPPVLEATPLTLRTALLDALADRESARELAARGPAFTREMHDGRRAATVLAQAFLEPGGGR